MHLAFGKQITAGVWGKISSESAVLMIFSTEMLGNQSAGWDTKPWNCCWSSPHLGWASLAGEMETQFWPLDAREGKKIGYPERKRRSQSEPVLHCHVVLMEKVLYNPNLSPWSSQNFTDVPSLTFQGLHCWCFHQPAQSKSISHSVLRVIMMFRAH